MHGITYFCLRSVLLCSFLFGLLYGKSCRTSYDCEDLEGRSICFHQLCHRDIPCNKDNDCFFYGAADISVGFLHPRCYEHPEVQIPVGYGVCMLAELAELSDAVKRMQGPDVVY